MFVGVPSPDYFIDRTYFFEATFQRKNVQLCFDFQLACSIKFLVTFRLHQILHIPWPKPTICIYVHEHVFTASPHDPFDPCIIVFLPLQSYM